MGRKRDANGKVMRDQTSKAIIESREFDVQCLELRKNGMNYRDIAAKLGCSVGGAHKAVSRSLDAIKDVIETEAQAVRSLELERLDIAIEAIVEQVRSGDLGAVDRWIKLSETRRKLLGLDMPAKLQITEGDLDAAIQAELAAMASTEQIGASGGAEEEE